MLLCCFILQIILRVVSKNEIDQLVDQQNEIIGKVASVVNFGAGDLLEIYFIKSSKKEFFRFTETNFPKVDIKEKRITIKS